MKAQVSRLVFLLICSLAMNAIAATRYVNLNSPSPTPPFTNWITAATNIQDAVDAAVAGDEIVVTNGVYETGARQVYGMSNRVAVTKAVVVRSVNGPSVTTIRGYQMPGAINGVDAIRCVYLTHNAVLVGFTLIQGATRIYGAPFTDIPAGGVWCEGASSVVSNCVITSNQAFDRGGGVYSGTLYNCSLNSNYAYNGGGAWLSTLINCTLWRNSGAAAGGAGGCTLNNCMITENWAQYYGGGLDGCVLNNCAIKYNYGLFGGGANGSTLINCVVVNNYSWPGGVGSGVRNSTLYNSIVYYSGGQNSENYNNSTFNYSCTTPLPNGPGNFTNAPLLIDDFANANIRFQSNSPCINAGNNAYVTTTDDLYGNPRIVGGTVDVGAYEYRSPYQVWLQQYGLPTDGSVDQLDSDGDTHKTWQEWVADTNPTNAASALRMVSATNNIAGANVTWQSVATRSYRLERSTNLGSAFSFQTIATKIAGAASAKTFIDTSATNNGPYFYRVGVE